MSLKFNLVFSLVAIASVGFSENSQAQIFRSGPDCCCQQPVVRIVQPTCPTVRYFAPAQSAVRVVARPIFQNQIVDRPIFSSFGFQAAAPIVNNTACDQTTFDAPIIYGQPTFEAPMVTEFASPSSFDGGLQSEVIYDGQVEPFVSDGVVISNEGAVAPATFNEPTAIVPTSVEPVPAAVEPAPLSAEPAPLSAEPVPLSAEPEPLSAEPVPLTAEPTPEADAKTLPQVKPVTESTPSESSILVDGS